jgi:membrane protease YdiL (CAAX protease family)
MLPVSEQTKATGPKRPSYVARLAGFLLPDRLQPPGWERFGGRWAALLILTGLWLVTVLNHELWFRPDPAGGGVSLLGISVAVGSQAATQALFRAAISTLCVMFLGAGLAIHGWKSFLSQLGSSDWLAVLYHVILVMLVLIASALLLERLGIYSGDPKTSSMTRVPKLYIIVRLLAVGLLMPAAEEFGLRYVCFGALRTRTKFIWAALLSSTLFGLLHFGYPDPVKMLLGVTYGLGLCWTYERTRSFATPLAIHVINNLLGV